MRRANAPWCARGVRLALSLCAALAMSFVGGAASADSAAEYVVRLGTPYPGDATNVEMTEEWVTFSNLRGIPEESRRRYAEEDFMMDVEARFRFTNLSSLDETVGMYFPICNALGGERCSPLTSDHRAIIELNGERLPYSVRTLRKDELNLETQLTFEGEFPGAAESMLVVRYVVTDATGKLPQGQIEFGYILESGAKWKGAIGRGTIRVELPYQVTPSSFEILAGDLWVPQPYATSVDGLAATMTFEDLEPTADDNLTFRMLTPETGARLELAEVRIQSVAASMRDRFKHGRLLAGTVTDPAKRHAGVVAPALRALFPRASEEAIATLAQLKFDLDFSDFVGYEHACDEEQARLLGALDLMLESEGSRASDRLQALVGFCFDASELYSSNEEAEPSDGPSQDATPMNRAIWRTLGRAVREESKTTPHGLVASRLLGWIASVAADSREDALCMLGLDEKELGTVTAKRTLAELGALPPSSKELAQFFVRYEEATRPDYASFEHLDQIREPTCVPSSFVREGDDVSVGDGHAEVADARDLPDAGTQDDVERTSAALDAEPETPRFVGWLLAALALVGLIVGAATLSRRRK
jgi:hypothetical protein